MDQATIGVGNTAPTCRWDRSDDVYIVDDEHLDIDALERELTEVRDRVEEQGRANGWEVDRLLEQARQRPSGA